MGVEGGRWKVLEYNQRRGWKVGGGDGVGKDGREKGTPNNGKDEGEGEMRERWERILKECNNMKSMKEATECERMVNM